MLAVPLERLLHPVGRGAQVCVGHREVGVAERVPHIVNRVARFQHLRARLAPQIVKVLAGLLVVAAYWRKEPNPQAGPMLTVSFWVFCAVVVIKWLSQWDWF